MCRWTSCLFDRYRRKVNEGRSCLDGRALGVVVVAAAGDEIGELLYPGGARLGKAHNEYVVRARLERLDVAQVLDRVLGQVEAGALEHLVLHLGVLVPLDGELFLVLGLGFHALEAERHQTEHDHVHIVFDSQEFAYRRLATLLLLLLSARLRHLLRDFRRVGVGVSVERCEPAMVRRHPRSSSRHCRRRHCHHSHRAQQSKSKHHTELSYFVTCECVCSCWLCE